VKEVRHPDPGEAPERGQEISRPSNLTSRLRRITSPPEKEGRDEEDEEEEKAN